MKRLYRSLLSAAPLGLLLLVLVAASRIDVPPTGGAEPKAVLQRLAPDSISAGSQDFTLTVRGAFFTRGSVVEWNGQPRPTDVLSGSLLRIRVPAADASAGGSAYVTVRSSTSPAEYPGVSNALAFRIIP